MDFRERVTSNNSEDVCWGERCFFWHCVMQVVVFFAMGVLVQFAFAKGSRHAKPENAASAMPPALVYDVPPLVEMDIEPVSAAPKTPPVLLLYNPVRPAELHVFTGAAQRFIQSARPLRPRFNAMSSRDKVQFLERYVFAMCNSRLVNGMDLVFRMETGSENFCGYSPGMLACFATDSCEEATYSDMVRYIKEMLKRYDRFIKWADKRKWEYRGDALKVGFYTRNTVTKSGMVCSTIKLINDNDEAAIVRMNARIRSTDGRLNTVFSRPYYIGPHASLPNLSDEDLFSKDTEIRMRSLTADAQALAKRSGILDIQAYTGTHERWNCFSTPSPEVLQVQFQKIHIEFPR